MEVWTEIKCFACSGMCGEAPGKGDHLETLRGMGRLLPGTFCTLAEGQLRCSRCGSLVYPGETYSDYVALRSDTVARLRAGPTASRVA